MLHYKTIKYLDSKIYWKGCQHMPIKVRDYYQYVAVLVLLYRCTTWILLEKKLYGNYQRMLCAVLNPGSNTPQNSSCMASHLKNHHRWTKRCWRSKNELISDILLYTPTHGCANVDQPAITFLYQLCGHRM